MDKNAVNRWIKILKESGLIIIVFVILMVVIVGCLLKVEFSWGFVDRKELLDTTGKILGGYLGCVTAYVTFKCQKELDKEKRQELAKREIEYKKFMLFSLLEFTIMNTVKVYNSLNENYLKIIASMSKSGIDIAEILSYKNSSSIASDLESNVTSILVNKDKNEVQNIIALLNDCLERILAYEDLKKLIYDNKWTDYIDCLDEIVNDNSIAQMQSIITWINLLSSDSENINSIDFVLKRRQIKFLIDKISPEIRKKGYRNNGFFS